MRCGRQDTQTRGEERECMGFLLPEGMRLGPAKQCGFRGREKYCPSYKPEDRPSELSRTTFME